MSAFIRQLNKRYDDAERMGIKNIYLYDRLMKYKAEKGKGKNKPQQATICMKCKSVNGFCIQSITGCN